MDRADQTPSAAAPANEEEWRDAAVRRLKRKRNFRSHLFVFGAVSLVLVAIWVATGTSSYWPVYPILGWGFVIAVHGWLVYGRKPLTEDAIQREEERLRG